LISEGKYCEAQPSFDNIIGTIQKSGGGVNEYNVRVIGEYNTTALDNYLNLSTTKTTLHVPTTITFEDCDPYAYQVLCSDFMNSVASLIPSILSQIRVLLYNG